MIRVAGSISIFVIIPYFVYQIWGFSIPGYYKFERQKINKFFSVFLFLVLIEFFFIYSFIFPKLCYFLLSFELRKFNEESNFLPISIEFSPRIVSYIKVTGQIFSFFLLLFQLPIIFVSLFVKNLLTSWNLCQQRKIVFFLCIFISALISPPDVLSQLFISGVFYFVYELTIFVGFLFYFKAEPKY